jgi:thiamine pyrophosphate-dependent acetolactate synthase large subunit-like protein
MVKAHDLVGPTLKRKGVDTAFFLMGGPMIGAMDSCIAEGIRMIDVRHEQAAAFMAQAYARLLRKPGVCMAAGGPGAANLITGLANALIDCVPVIALGGSSPVGQYGTGGFQEIDQVAMMRPVTKWAERVYDARRIPEYIDKAYRIAMSGKPGPVYLDLPGDVLYSDVPEQDVVWPNTLLVQDGPRRITARDEDIARAATLLREARQPLIFSGGGALWSGASSVLTDFVDSTGIPIYTTPQGRGIVPEDHDYSYLRSRSLALREADVILIAGTRMNYVFGYGKPPRFSERVKFIRIDIDPTEIAAGGFTEVGIVGDIRTVVKQLGEALDCAALKKTFEPWRRRLGDNEASRRDTSEAKIATDQIPIHPLRLCKEIRDFIDRDAVLVVDGQEILNYGRQTIPTFVAGHRLNSGPFGTMGVGLPFGVGAKAAMPDKLVVVLHGDGSLGLNVMELDTAVRHKLPVLLVVSLNGGWTADPLRNKPGRDLGYTRFDKLGESLGCHAEYVEQPGDIRPALERAVTAVRNGQTAVVNVVTDWKARAQTADFTAYAT